jgi:cytochrome c-type biogenesis protein CcmH
MRRASGIAALVIGVTAAALTAQAAPATSGNQPSASGVSRLDDSVRAVASMLRCPVCQGESIQESPSELAKEMRQVVREQLAAGKSSDEVKAYFVSKYGEWILLEPKPRGMNLAVYLMPLLLLIGGAVGIVIAVQRWTRHPAETESDSP